MSAYTIVGNQIRNGMTEDGFPFCVAICDEPQKAVELMERAHFLNDVKRKYTASARLFHQVEQLPGFAWREMEVRSDALEKNCEMQATVTEINITKI